LLIQIYPLIGFILRSNEYKFIDVTSNYILSYSSSVGGKMYNYSSLWD